MPVLLRSSIYIIFFIWLLAGSNYALAQNQPALTLTIIPTAYPNWYLPQAVISPKENGGHFHVLLTNTSAAPIALFEEWNEWGYFGLSFDITYSDGRKVHVYKADRMWDHNYPSTLTLPPKGVYVFEVNFDDTWANTMLLRLPWQQGVACRLRAIYSITPRKDGTTLNRRGPTAWTGTVRSVELPCSLYVEK